jgi:hypothetical protein
MSDDCRSIPQLGLSFFKLQSGQAMLNYFDSGAVDAASVFDITLLTSQQYGT